MPNFVRSTILATVTPAQLTRRANTLARKLTKTFPQWRFSDASYVVADGFVTASFRCEHLTITKTVPDTPTAIDDLQAWALEYEEFDEGTTSETFG